MVKSMTGFGRSKLKSADHVITVEMKSVNHRFSEFQIRMPRQLMKIEDKIKKKLAQYIHRGRVELFISIDGEGFIHRTLQADWTLIEEYIQLMEVISDKYQLAGQPELKDLLQRPDFITIEENEEENIVVEQLVLEAVEQAVEHLHEMRLVEGAELKKDLVRLLNSLEQRLSEVKQFAPLVIQSYRHRLERRLTELTATPFDQDRILTEIAIFAEKSDIHEECIRLDSHMQQFQQTLELPEPIGRKLDFMIQEMNREVNTIGSKANDSKISSAVVELKTTLEKMREQIQNIE
ncbi:YicC/YloC family endoribonuclease [Bacillus sp. FJAT-42315]|uniref:YicC/YloC family endoribonuclease n=1 Tax=Bacillus sp. FJAT-42315 TaxID=2014077 RepID=UPI000C23A060|nr:YicC/YloC family endoribonuclease [Bacillus sp. FJAT-42315]